jgi:hypothetical protein
LEWWRWRESKKTRAIYFWKHFYYFLILKERPKKKEEKKKKLNIELAEQVKR